MSPYVTVVAGLGVGIMLGWFVEIGDVDFGPDAGVVMSEDHASLIRAEKVSGRVPDCPPVAGSHCRHFPVAP